MLPQFRLGKEKQFQQLKAISHIENHKELVLGTGVQRSAVGRKVFPVLNKLSTTS
jgi:hypothetical protein